MVELSMEIPILAPAATLVLWSMVVLFWMVGTRFLAFKTVEQDLSNAEPGGRYQDTESQMPTRVIWKSHNYTHLMEKPTLFYAVVVVLALVDEGRGLNLAMAWAYGRQPGKLH